MTYCAVPKLAHHCNQLMTLHWLLHVTPNVWHSTWIGECHLPVAYEICPNRMGGTGKSYCDQLAVSVIITLCDVTVLMSVMQSMYKNVMMRPDHQGRNHHDQWLVEGQGFTFQKLLLLHLDFNFCTKDQKNEKTANVLLKLCCSNVIFQPIINDTM